MDSIRALKRCRCVLKKANESDEKRLLWSLWESFLPWNHLGSWLWWQMRWNTLTNIRDYPTSGERRWMRFKSKTFESFKCIIKSWFKLFQSLKIFLESPNEGQSTPKTTTQKPRDIHSLLPLGLPGQHTFIVVTRSYCLFLMNSDGQTIKVYCNDTPLATESLFWRSFFFFFFFLLSLPLCCKASKGSCFIFYLMKANESVAQLGPGVFSPFVTSCSPLTHSPSTPSLKAHSWSGLMSSLPNNCLSQKIYHAEVIGLPITPQKHSPLLRCWRLSQNLEASNWRLE